VELLVVSFVIAVLTALLLPVVNHAKTKAKRTVCIRHLNQIHDALMLYAGDSDYSLPARLDTGRKLDASLAYEQALTNYYNSSPKSLRSGRIFICPADTFYYDRIPMSSGTLVYVRQGVHHQARYQFSSYAFNGGNQHTNKATGRPYPGLAGRKLSSLKGQNNTILVAEVPAFYGWSWHEPQQREVPHYYNNAMNMALFVGGNVRYQRFYWDGTKPTQVASEYDPPPEYGYRWSAD